MAIAAAVLVGGSNANAQGLQSCQAAAARPSVAVAAAGAIADVRIDPPVADVGPYDEARIRHGFEITATGEIPVSPRFGVRLEYGRGDLGIGRQIFNASHTEVVRTTHLGTVDHSHVTAGIVRHATAGRRLCGYVAAAAGVYRFSFGDYHASAAGVSGTLGFEVPTASPAGLILELQLNAIGNRSRLPLGAQTFILFKGSAGVRVHF